MGQGAPIRAVALVALLVVAGCMATADPPPGVEGDVLDDRETLADAHHDAMLSSGLVYWHNVTVVPHDTTGVGVMPENDSTMYRVEPNATEYYSVRMHPNGTARGELRGTAERLVTRTATDDGDEYSSFANARERLPIDRLTGRLYVLGWTTDFDDVRVAETIERDGRSLTVLVGNHSVLEHSPPTSARLEVDSDGVLRRGWWNQSHSSSAGNAAVVTSFELVRTGNVTVERPGWVDNATDQSRKRVLGG